MPDISNGKNTDFFFIDMEKTMEKERQSADPFLPPGSEISPSEIADRAANEIVTLVKTKLSRYYRTASREIQVLTPMQRGVVGAANLNQALQAAINPGPGMTGRFHEPDQVLRRGGMVYRRGDKVMQIRNNYDKEVFIGDIGFIESIDMEERTLRVNIDDRSVEYDASELDELVLAYATTIHKAQGSEYPIVVIPVLMNHYVMLQRNLIYTGITRAKKILVLVGTKKALSYAVRHLTVDKRNTMLKERIQKLIPAGKI
jgi:exodeoxyribonuclease V alpha subunit